MQYLSKNVQVMQPKVMADGTIRAVLDLQDSQASDIEFLYRMREEPVVMLLMPESLARELRDSGAI